MQITKLELENFKRFTKLTIDMSQLDKPPKLVLLIGANGSGKSCVFDAFEATNTMIKSRNGNRSPSPSNSYYQKDKTKLYQAIIHSDKYGQIVFDKDEQIASIFDDKERDGFASPKFREEALHLFYGRTSFRQVSRLTRLSAKNGFNVEDDSDRSTAWIDRDERFENDVEKTTTDLLKLLFDTGKTVTNEEIREKFIDPINVSLGKIFGENAHTSIRFISIVPPGDGLPAEILFKKGDSIMHYNLLSAGEKEVFNILLNLSVRGKYYQDSIYFIDEMDLHLEYNTQKNLLKEITESWIPERCQFWVASHSLGFIQYANESEHSVIIDFDNLDFDQAQTIYPSAKNTTEVFEIAVSREFISQLFSGRRLVFAENRDTAIYNEIGIKDTFFFIANDKIDVFHKSKNLNQLGLADRDYLTDEEVVKLKETYKFLRILNYYSIENYLYHPDNLAEFYGLKEKPFNKEQYKKRLIDEKNANLLTGIVYGVQQARSGYPFFKENENQKQLKLFREQGTGVVEMLKNTDFETFYKVFPAKDYGKTLTERQNLSKSELGKTKWFRGQIEKILGQ